MTAKLSAEILKIPLAQLVPSPYNVRSIRTQARIEELAHSLAEDGQKEPITVYPGEKNGEYLILSGVTRYLAAQSLSWETLDVRETLDFADSPLAVVKSSRLHNDTQRETELDHAILARTLQEAGHTAAEIAKALGYGSRRDISRLKAYFELPAAILEQGKERPEKFSASFAELLKRAVWALGETWASRLLKQVFDRDLSLNETTVLIEEEESHTVRVSPSRSRCSEKRKFNLAGKEIGDKTVLVTPGGQMKIRLSLTLDASLSEALNVELDRVLERFMAEAERGKDA